MKQTYGYQQKARQFFAVLLPIFITQLSLMATGFFNTIMAGHISQQDLAGVAVGVNLFLPFFGSVLGIISGLTPTISQLYGGGRQDKIGFIVKQGFYWALTLAVLFIALGWLAVPRVLPLLNLEPKVHDITVHYLLAVSFGIVPIFLAGVLRNFIDAHGHTRLTMCITMTSVPVNIVLNYVFMYGLFGIPEYATDPDYASIAVMQEKDTIKHIIEVCNEIFLTKTAQEWRDYLSSNNCSCEILREQCEVSTDPQAIENEYMVPVEYPDENHTTVMMPSPPISFSDYGRKEYKPTGCLVEHTDEILASMGYTPEQIQAMKDAGAVK